MRLYLQIIAELIKRKAATVQVTEVAQQRFMDHVHKDMPKTVWGSNSCGSW